jgi:DNA-binding NarL/FixJ family response regulator
MSLMTKAGPPVVAVFNASEDTVDLLTVFFEQEGFQAVGRTWKARDPLNADVAIQFMSKHQPNVVVFDVSMPYEPNWERFREFQELGERWRVPVVLTTTNKHALTQCVGASEALEIIGKPYDLDELLTAVRRALAITSGPTT